MTHLPRHSLWLGHAGDGRNPRQLFDAGIQAVVHLAAEEPAPQLPRDLWFFRLPLLDGAGNGSAALHLALVTVAALLELRMPTLVYCSAGMSRSPAIAAGALAVLHRRDADECLAEVVAGRPADVSPGLWADIKAQSTHMGCSA